MINYSLFIFIIIQFIGQYTFSQSIGHNYANSAIKKMHDLEFCLAIEQFDLALEYFKTENELINYCYLLTYKANCLEEIESYDMMDMVLTEALKLVDTLELTTHFYLLADINFLYGTMYSDIGDTNLGNYHLIKSLKLISCSENGFSYRIDNIYKQLGFNSIKEGNYKSGITFFEQALKSNPSADPAIKSNWLSSIADCYVFLQMYEKANAFFNMALVELQKETKISKKYYLVNYYEDKLHLYLENENLKKAKNTLDRIKKYNPTKNEKINFHINLGKYYLLNKNLERSLTEFQKAVDICKSNYINNLYKLGHTHLEYGIALMKSKEFEKAIEVFNQSNSHLIYLSSQNDNKIHLIPNIKLLNSLNKSLCYSELNNEIKFKEEVNKSFKFLEQLLRTKLITEDSQLFLIENIRIYYKKLFIASTQFSSNEFSFQLLSKIQGKLLQLQILYSDQKDDSILESKINLIKLESQLMDQNVRLEINKLEDLYYKELLKLEAQKIELENKLSTDFENPSQENNFNLRQNQALIQYLVNEDELYILMMCNNENFILRKKLDPEFRKNINLYLSSLNNIKSHSSDFAKMSYNLYNILLKDILKLTSYRIKNLIIIPDDILHLVPFGSLIDNLPFNSINQRFDNLPYLVKKYNISYHYSSILLNNKHETIKENLVGIAPNYYSHSKYNLSPLLYNKAELTNIKNITDGEILTDSLAKLSILIDTLKNYNILHLAAHAVTDDSLPFKSKIFFSDTTLHLYNIYNLSHNLDLAVLSACQTANGKLKKGEGLMSLARAFILSGCKSVITSLWNVNDQKSVDIMGNFYSHLYQGETIGNSLTQAKRDYLKNVNSVLDAHPYHWATFIMVGNADMAIPTFPWASFLLILSVLLIVVLLFRKVRKKV